MSPDNRPAKNIMIQGTMSNVGKSLLCAALCRVLKQDGLRCVPFKSQNMALNSGVTMDGLEMGRAQILQAQAAGVECDVRMNPVLLKPSSDTGSQVIVNGKVYGQLSARQYMAEKKRLIPQIMEAYESLAKEADVVVIEGAGSPAEINLRKDDIVNMGLARMVDAPVLLAGDIDPGGVFAQLYGTVKLLQPAEQARIRGLIINKFRGDKTLLDPGIDMLKEMLSIPVAGVIPYMNLKLEDEDSMSKSLRRRYHNKPVDIGVIRFPKISNFTDLDPLSDHPLLGIRYISHVQEFGSPDMIILPGTKSTMADMKWLRQTGLASRIIEAAGRGIYILGICGGYQMLGESLSDPQGAEGSGENASCPGLGLLPVKTSFGSGKIRRRVRGRIAGGYLDGVNVYGYEIHMGQTTGCMEDNAAQVKPEISEGTVSSEEIASPEDIISSEQIASPEDIISSKEIVSSEEISSSEEIVSSKEIVSSEKTVSSEEIVSSVEIDPSVIRVCSQGHVCGTYLHGLFDSGEAIDRIADILARQKGITNNCPKTPDLGSLREEQLDLLADTFRQHMDMELVYRIIERKD